MKFSSHVLLATVLVAGLIACSREAPPAPSTADETTSKSELVARAGAPLFDGMGDHHHPITTNDADAQKYFDQGLTIDFAFNHAESVRSFRAAQRLDPDCAMCYWGEALALGPNINVTSNGKVVMSDEDRVAAHAAIQKAVQLKDGATERERDYIDALATRYNGDPSTPREPLDEAYANAMRALYQKYPDDDDAASLFAESLMNTMPWDYWVDADNPKPMTVEVLDALETVLRQVARITRWRFTSTYMRSKLPRIPGAPKGRPTRLPTSCRAPATSCICRLISTGGSDDITMPRRPTSRRQLSTNPTSPSAMRRVSIRRCTTRTTSTSCGRHPAWKAAAKSRSKRQGRSLQTSGSK